MIELTTHGRVAVLTLNRTEKHNALNIELCHRLREAVVQAAGSRAVVLTGAGRSFCSGADLDEVYTTDFREALYGMLHAVEDAPMPVVAAVNGPAIGAGAQLAIAADFRVVAARARYAVPTARLGLAVDPWTIRRLALVAGTPTARRLLLACTEVCADEALACGLADRAGDPVDALAWAQELSELAPLTQSYSKRVLNEAFEQPLDDALAKSLDEAFEGCWASEDFVEGRRARSERRPPDFRGR